MNEWAIGGYHMPPGKQMEVIPRIWEKCIHLRKLRIKTEIPCLYDEENNEASRNFHRLIYLLQVRTVC